jgi:IS30 family transposase
LVGVNNNPITEVAVDSVTRIRVAWALRKKQVPVGEIAQEVGRDRATVYRWLKGIKLYGIEEFIRRYKKAKRGRRVRKTHPHLEQRVLSLRREYRGCCGQKIVYLLGQEGTQLSVSTVYRILNKHLKLRKHSRTPKGEPVEKATRAREVIQMDTLDLGELYAYTAIDTFTREGQVLIRPSLQAEDGKAALEQIMQVFGHCEVIQTDGGSEFEKDFAEVVDDYADHHRIARPYKKNEQAFIECFNGTLRREEFGHTPFKASELELAQQRANAYLDYYHNQRPHLALDMMTPAKFAESHLR